MSLTRLLQGVDEKPLDAQVSPLVGELLRLSAASESPGPRQAMPWDDGTYRCRRSRPEFTGRADTRIFAVEPLWPVADMRQDRWYRPRSPEER